VYNDGLRNAGLGPRYIWAECIAPYIKNREIFACPGGPHDVNPRANLQGTRYNMNMCANWSWPEDCWYGGVGAINYPVKQSMIKYPSELAFTFESLNHWWCHWLGHPGWDNTSTSSDGLVIVGTAGETIYPRHNGGCNVSFVDGHAKWHSTEAIYGQAKREFPYPRMFSIRQP
jgi:prepilin-type processing-associated H-X9-DG protein